MKVFLAVSGNMIFAALSRFRSGSAFRGILAVGAAVVFALLPLPGVSRSAQQTPQIPRIRVSTRLVQVDIIVRDKNGPVENLTKDDFAVFDRGKPQVISLFAVDSTDTAKTATPTTALSPPSTFSNLPQSGADIPSSLTIVLLDNLNTLYGSSAESEYERTPYWIEDLALQNAKAHLVEFVQHLQSEDRVAIYGLRDRLHILCDFTSNRDQLLAVLKKYDTSSVTKRAVVEPGYHTSPQHVADGFENEASAHLVAMANEDRATQTVAGLQSIAAHMANIPGRKNLVWLTANLPFSGTTLARVLSPANIAVYPVDARGLLPISPVTLANIPGTADADDVSGASGHVDNMPAQSSQPIGIATMQKLADETGGQAFVNTNDITGAIRKAVEDSAVTYTLGFYINSDALDGKFHELRVEVRRGGLTVRYPKAYFAYPDTAPTKDEEHIRLLTAVRSALESSVIPLQATLARVNQPAPNSLSLSCSIDFHNLQLVQNGNLRKGAVVVYVIGQDQTGKIVFQWDKPYNFQFTDAQYTALLKSGMMFHQYLHLKAGVATLRVLVEEPSTSQLGSLIIPLSQIK